jgi:hypothetical protein
MNHLNEEALIEHYYGERSNAEATDRHLKACAECGRNYAALRRDLEGMKSLTPPARDGEYGARVWASIRSSLPVYERKRSWMPTGLWRPLGLITACALLVVAAFIAGRRWERRETPTVAVGVAPDARQKVVVLVLGEHLDRSERLLVALNHAEPGDESAPLQTEARELLAANRLVRQSAQQAGDPTVEASLERLERLLVELANEPDGLSEADLKRIREEMNTEGLLFDVRVLQSRVSKQEQRRQEQGTGIGKGVNL